MIRKSEGTVDKTYLKELEKTIVMYDSLTKTGNAALDVILSEKKLLCEKYGITLACIVDGKALNFMSDVDIYSLFGNILDNAMQAVDKLEHPEEKIINLNVITQNGFISIHQDNRYVGELIFQDGLPLTTNADKVEHGFGMSSMRYIVNKYNGSIATLAAQGIFEINILLQIKN